MPIRPIFAVLGILCLSFTVWAGQGFEVLQYNQKTLIDKLGVRYKTTTAEYYVSSEAGRITFSNYRVNFIGASENFKLDELYTTIGNVKTVTDAKQISITEVQSDQTGMGSTKLASLPLSSVQVGSRIHIAYTLKLLPPVSGFANEVLTLSTRDLGKNESYEYESEVPLQVLPLYFADLFKFEKSIKNQKYYVKFSPTPKAFSQSAKQPGQALAYISTYSSWESANRALGSEYRKVWQSELPPELNAIVFEMRKIQNVKDKVEYAARKVHGLIAYSGNWVTERGQVFPQNFVTLAKTKRGDCKDYSTALTAVLNKAGIQAYPALTWRADQFNVPEIMKSLSVIPSMDLFNHIIVWVKDPASAKTWWVDATNPYINVEVVSRDLLSGFALILDEKQNALSFLPDQNAVPVETTLTQVVKLNGPLMEGQGRLQMNAASYNEFALYEAMNGASASQKFMTYILGAQQSLQVSVHKKAQTSPQLNEFEFGYVGATYLIEDDDKNKWIKFPNLSADLMKGIKTRQLNYLGELGRFTKVTSFEDMQTVDEYSADCTVRTKWLDYDRMIENVNGRIVVTETVKYKKRYMLAAETDPETVHISLSDFYSCSKKSLITVNISEKAKTEQDRKREAQLGPSVYKMTLADAKVLERKSLETGLFMDKFNKLIKVYNLALKKNPQDVEAYVQKARLFMSMSPMGEDTYDEAYLRETVDLLVRAQSIKKEYNQEIYTLLFHAHLNLKNFDLANGYYRVLCAESKSPFLEHSFGADLEEARGNFAAAEKHILELSTFKVQSNESFPFYEPQLARIYFKSKKYDLAEKLYLKFNSVNAAGIDSAKFLSHIYFEQKDYDKIVALDKKQTEMRSANRVPTSMLSEAHYFRILKKYGLTQASDGTISAEELKKVSAMPTLIEKDLAEIAQIDVANTKPLQLLIKLNSYLYQTKQQPVFSSKVDYYTTLLNKIRQSGGDAQRDVSSVSKETAPSN